MENNLSGSLHVTPEQYEKLSELVTKYLKKELIATPSAPVNNAVSFTPELTQNPNITFSEDGANAEQVLNELFAKYQVGRKPIHPGYLNFLPGGGLSTGAFADLISDTMNRHTGFVENCPALVDLEVSAIKWLCSAIYGKVEESEPFGILTSGGSMAHWSGLAIALNEKKKQLSSTTKQHPLVLMSKFRIYLHDQTHFCILKAAKLLGFTDENLVLLPTNEAFTYDMAKLESHIEEDKKNGWIPFVVVGNAGTTNTGAIDDLQALYVLAKRHDMWYHIDACFGGFYKLTKKGSELLTGIELGDTIALDPHKGFFLPYGTGCLLTRDIHTLKRAFSASSIAPYLNSHAGSEHEIATDDVNYFDIADMGPELTRPFRGLRIWFPLKLHGVSAFETAASERLEVTQYFYQQLQKRFEAKVEILHQPTLSVLVFRFVNEGETEEVIETRNRKIMDIVNSRNKVGIYHTKAKGKFAIRVIFSSFRATREIAQTCIDEFVEANKTL